MREVIRGSGLVALCHPKLTSPKSTRLEAIRKAADRVYNPHLLPEALQELFTTESGQRAYEKWLRE